MKKIKVMNMIWSMKDGGAQQIVLNYLRDFQNDPDIEFRLCVYTSATNSKYDKEIKEKGYNVVYLNNPHTKIQIPYIKRFFQTRISQKTWIKAIHEYKPDIVHVHISGLLADTMPGILQENIPIRFDTLHSNPYRYKGRTKKVITDAFLKHGVIPICLTEEQMKMAKDWYGIEHCEILHNGIDVKNIQRKIITKNEAREKFKITKDAFVIIGVGRLNPIKRFDLLIRVFEKVKEKVSNAKLIIAGDGSERDNLLRIVNKLNLSQDVYFLGNIDNVIDLYCAADVLAMPSYSEASPLVAIEAQVCGLRCVISDGVPAESVITSNTQKLYSNATENDWCQALLSENYVGNPVAREEDYELHSVCRKLKNIYLKYFSRG